ncbi:MAG TPA: DUF2993 domain-containing protein [Jatrophihabitans sp.]|nr:DUF2993 domain-containing protein [Jatrophihabitans sp.]
MPVVTDYVSATRPARRGHRGRALIIVVLVLALLLATADRVGAAVADRVIAAKIQSSQHLSRQPNVTIEGFPFLTQVLRNHYQAIKASGSDITVGAAGQPVTVASFQARLTGVSTFDNFHGVTADTATGTATIGFDQLAKVLGVPLSYAPGGRVQATRTVTVLGQQVTGTVSAVVTVPGGDQLAFSDVRVAVQGVGVSVPSSVTDELSSVFARKLSLAGLPFGLRITTLTTSPAGVRVSAVADHIRLS